MFDFVTLPGGLRLAGERLTHVRSCTVGVWVRVGSMNELPEENGLSHFIEHMFSRARKTAPRATSPRRWTSPAASSTPSPARNAPAFTPR